MEYIGYIGTGLTVAFIVISVIGALSGLSKGAFRSGLRLLINALTATVTTVLAITLRGRIPSVIKTAVGAVSPDAFAAIESMGTEASTLLDSIIASLEMLVFFAIIFFGVRIIFFIPEAIICRYLPKRFPEKKNESDSHGEAHVYEPVLENSEGAEPSEAVETVEAPTPEKPKSKAGLKLLWHTSAAICGAASAILVLSAIIMPLASTLSRLGGTVTSACDALIANEIRAEEKNELLSAETLRNVKACAEDISSNVMIKTSDFIFGKLAFEPILTLKTAYGDVNLAAELTSIADTAVDTLPAFLRISEEKALSVEDGALISDTVKKLSESRLLTTAGSVGLHAFGPSFVAPKETDKQAMRELKLALGDIIENTTPDTLSADMVSVADIASLIAGTDIVKYVLETMDAKKDAENTASLPKYSVLDSSEGEENEPEEEKPTTTVGTLLDVIASDSFTKLLSDTFTLAYDNEHLKSLLVPTINVGSEVLFESLKATPIYSDVDLSTITREELEAEAEKLSGAISSIASFVESVDGDITNLKFDEAGKALDALKDSTFFGGSYEEIVTTVTEMVAGGEEGSTNEQFAEIVKDALVNSESAENVLSSAQSMVIIKDTLEKSELKGKENPELVSALETLGKNNSLSDRQTVEDLAESVLGITLSGEGADPTVAEILTHTVKAMNEIIAEGKFDAASEADAIQQLYDLSRADKSTILQNPGDEKELVDVLCASEVAVRLFKNLNTEGRDFGINDKISDANRKAIKDAVSSASASDDVKSTVLAFFKIA